MVWLLHKLWLSKLFHCEHCVLLYSISQKWTESPANIYMAQRALDHPAKTGLEQEREMERESDCELESMWEKKISVYVTVKGHLCISKWVKALLLSSAFQTVQIDIQKYNWWISIKSVCMTRREHQSSTVSWDMKVKTASTEINPQSVSCTCKGLFLQSRTHKERSEQHEVSYPLYLKLFNALRA